MSTKIEWTDVTWNPVSGCSKISAGCKNCYAERMAKRLQHMGTPGYDNGFAVTLHHDKLKQPFHWRKPKRIFVCSMADLFHEDVPNGFIQQVFSTMANNPHHTFQVLTKRSERMRDFVRGYVRGFDGVPLPNVWLGVSVENSDARRRIGHLLDTPAAFRFLSCEPLLEHVDLTENMRWLAQFPSEPNIHWVIVGGESGPNARPMNIGWARSLRDQCEATGTPFFFKQWGGKKKKQTCNLLDGREHHEFPDTKEGSDE